MILHRTIPFKGFCLVLSVFLTLSLFLSHRSFVQLNPSTTPPPTSLRHLLFSVASSSRFIHNRIPLLRLWYNPNSTRALLFLDSRLVHPLPPFLPPVLVSADASRYPYTFRGASRSAIRIARIVKEAVNRNEEDVRWFVFGDDDTLFFPENLARVLSKYDHNRWFYVGSNSESYEQNEESFFEMAFGGGGFAISASLAVALARVLDPCLMRYPHLYGSDARIFSCLAELGVSLTREPGFHQVDVRGDLFGLLTAHPLSPLVSLHHLEQAKPIFPNMSHLQALERLFTAVHRDPLRILQQAVCYESSRLLTISVAWGYSVQVYEGNILLPELLQPLRTFFPWKRRQNRVEHYMFKSRTVSSNPCENPAVFFLSDVLSAAHGTITRYKRDFGMVCSTQRGVLRLRQIKVISSSVHSHNPVLF